jgi:transcriptional regulator with XRE-family HTH domain
MGMNITQAVKRRFEELCYQKELNFCQLAHLSGVPYTTVKSIFYDQSKNPGIATIKKLCDGLEISITDFFDTDVFRNLEQEIQ